MTWLYYLLEANLYLLVFYAFYRLFLHDETFYNSNRYFLLLSSLIAFALPLMQIGLLKPAVVSEPISYQVVESVALNQPAVEPITPEAFDFSLILYPIYLIIAAGFAFKLVIGVIKILKMWIKADKKRSGNIILVRLQDNAAFSFFNLLFIHPHLADKKAVVAHEMVHIKQKHSFDIILFELLQILCWFNPIIHFIKKDIKLLHEYIADELSTNAEMQKHEYAMFLIENSFGVAQTALTNQIFNQSILKRRINMLNKERTAGRARLRLLLAIPLAAGMLCTSTMAFTKDYGYIDLLPEKSNVIEAVPQDPGSEQELKKPTNKSTKKPTSPKAAVTKKSNFKYPPPVVRPDRPGSRYFRTYKDKQTGKLVSSEKRLIVIDGKPLEEGKVIFGVEGAKSIKDLNSAEAVQKYGESARFGAVEIEAPKVILDKITFPPPRVHKAPSPPRIERAPAPPRAKKVELTPVPSENQNKNISKVRLRIDSGTRTNVRIRKIEPTRVRLTELRSEKMVATRVESPREVIEVRQINSPKGRLKKVIATRPIEFRATEMKEVTILPTKAAPAKQLEAVEVRLIPTAKGTPPPAKGNN